MKRVMFIYLLSVFICCFAFGDAAGQCPPLYTYDGEAAGDYCGVSVAGGGDVNNDGYNDFAFGAYSNDAGGIDLGSVYVISGQTRDTLYIFHGEGAIDIFGGSVCIAGDIDDDGFDDIAIGARRNDGFAMNAGRAYVFSGRTGDTLYVFSGGAESDNFGYSVSSAGDVNNDGYDDLVVSAPLNDSAGSDFGRVFVFSGMNGDTLFIFNGKWTRDNFGWSVSSAGDVDNDSYDDVIIGANLNDGTGLDAGQAYVFSGQTGDTLYVFSGEAAGDGFGGSVALTGDLDSDGYDDVIIGAPHNNGAGVAAGRAYVFSGQTGDTLYVFSGEAANNGFGSSVASAGNVNMDGFDDVIVGAPGSDGAGVDAGMAYVFSGLTGDTLHVFSGEAAGDIFGCSVSTAGDLDNDGFDDVIIGAYMNDGGGSDAGRVYVFSCCCLGGRGDVNKDGADANVLDLSYLVDRIFRGGPEAKCDKEADVNSDNSPSNILDLAYLVDFIFRGGPAPGSCY